MRATDDACAGRTLADFQRLIWFTKSPGFIVRYGALRMSQVALVLLAAGTALATLGTPLMLVLSAIISGGGAAVSTPASSHLLGRCSPPGYLPLVFSIKQTAVPAGLLLGGALGPQLTEWMDWRGTMLLNAAACAVFVLMLQPLRKIFDVDRVPTRTFRLSDFTTRSCRPWPGSIGWTDPSGPWTTCTPTSLSSTTACRS